MSLYICHGPNEAGTGGVQGRDDITSESAREERRFLAMYLGNSVRLLCMCDTCENVLSRR